MDELTAARVAREAIRAYQREIGDQVAPDWEQADQWQRESTQAAVRLVRAGTTPAELHGAWVADRRHRGWRHPSEPEATTAPHVHRNLVPYDTLPANQQVKDRLFIAVVGALLP
jgi:hypothetical protein